MGRVIRLESTGVVVEGDGGRVVLPALSALRAAVVAFLNEGGLTLAPGSLEEGVAVELLAETELDYAIGPEDEIEIVLTAPEAVAKALLDYDSLPTQFLMAALYECCPDLGGDRVVARSP